MSAYHDGRRPAGFLRARIARPAALAALLALAGCATHPNQYAQTATPPTRVAHAMYEVEDDGLPVQTPPPARIRDAPDEPSEPFSRNYGGPNPSATKAPRAKTAAAPPPKQPEPVLPDDLPPAFRQKILAAIAEES
ncbi:MAG: adhesin [Hyphomicrobium sp.]